MACDNSEELVLHLSCTDGLLYCDRQIFMLSSEMLKDLQKDTKELIDFVKVPFTKECVKMYVKFAYSMFQISMMERIKIDRVIEDFLLLVEWFDPPEDTDIKYSVEDYFHLKHRPNKRLKTRK